MSLPFIPTACETSAIRVCYLFPPCWRLWGFFCRSVWGTVNSHVCKCTRNDVSDVLLCARLCECESWLFPLEFPENPDSVHLIATHHIVTLGARYGTCSAYPAFLPFHTSLFCFTENFLLLLNMYFFLLYRAAFYWNSSLRGCFFCFVFSNSHTSVITQSWKSLLDQWMLVLHRHILF